jgi:hypothetical protein
VSLVRRSGIQFVSAVGVVIALAVFDLGPRAGAAFWPAAGTASAAGYGTLGPTTDADSLPPPGPDNDRTGLPVAADLVPGGGGLSAPSSSGPSSGTSPVAGDLPRTEPPAGGLVVYFREPAARFDLSAFIDSILDPPRHD